MWVGRIHHGTPEDGFALYHYIEGIKCDFGHGLVAKHESLLSEILEQPTLDLVQQTILSGFLDAIPLHGAAWISHWLTQMAQYPPELAEAMIKQHLHFHPRWVLLTMGIERRDQLFLSESLLKAAENIIGLLCGLNQVYHPGKLKGLA